jgi:uncharacterized membrane protein YgcG
MKIIRMLFITLVLVISMATIVQAEVTIIDTANLLSDTEERNLKSYTESKFSEYKDINILFYYNNEPIYDEEEHEDFAEKTFYDTFGKKSSGVMLYVNMEDRYIDCSSYGKYHRRVTASNCVGIYNDIAVCFKGAEYNYGSERFVDDVLTKVQEPYVKKLFIGFGADIILTIIVFIIYVCVCYFRAKGLEGGKASGYINDGTSDVSIVKETYLRTEVKETRRESNSSSGGSHHSSSGHSSHGGGHF